MMAGALPPVADAALAEGAAGLARFRLRLFRPVSPMLAETAPDVERRWRLGEAAFEYKLDGARVQVHRDGDEVRVYTRALHDVTAAVPEVVEVARALPAAARPRRRGHRAPPDGAPEPFQVTMRRFGRKLDVAALRRELPLTPVFFDVLHPTARTSSTRPPPSGSRCSPPRARGAAGAAARDGDAARPRAFLADALAAATRG